jgi:hypothetical protein
VDTTAAFNVRLARLTPHGTGEPGRRPLHDHVTRDRHHARCREARHRRDLRQHLHRPDVRALRRAHAGDHGIRLWSGNTFVASFAPHGSPPPTSPTATQPPAPPAVTADAHAQVARPAPAEGATATGQLHLTIPTPAPPPSTTTTPAPPPNLVGPILKSVLGG